MSKGSGTKKKKAGPSPQGQQDHSSDKNMPRLPRTPGGEAPTPDQGSQKTGGSIEELLLGMEGRLGSKIDSTNKKVDKTLTLVSEANAGLEELELKVVDAEINLDSKLAETETRIELKVKNQVKTLVLDQLRSAGFDPDLTATDMSTIRSVNNTSMTYAGAAPITPARVMSVPDTRSKLERQEDKYWNCRKTITNRIGRRRQVL